ncbi:alpha/beta hydrolase [Pontixanthobacter gangjinensis]|uniref:Alpha/beta hydrolase n=1 Tax=Christiangramia aestuarii TaxID=1028746 RepID=A0A7K1LN34_9FLAO|nr:alpha/beta hydrolase [Christiangramia aestuarii]MUP42215.1 alpha/beta hydrolase [Christiangramia aestuarii]
MIQKTELNNGISLEYLDQGEGEVVLLLHGLGSTRADWDFQKDAFSEDFRIIAPDLRGHGNSSRPSGKDAYGIPKCAEDMKLLLESLGISSCMVVGFSMGGAVAFQMAAEYKDLVSKLVIVNTAPDFNALGEMGEQMIKDRTQLLRSEGMEAMAAKVSEGMFPEEKQKHLRKIFFERAHQNDLDAYYHSFITLMGWGIGEKIRNIEVPALVVASDMDYTPVDLKKSYAEKMPDAKVVVIQNSRHGVTMDQPEQFNKAVLKFLKS